MDTTFMICPSLLKKEKKKKRLLHKLMGVKRGELSTETTWKPVRWVRDAELALRGRMNLPEQGVGLLV